jgi:ActR/RegA family two-component response regulator
LPNAPAPRWFTDPGRIPAQSILALDDDLTLQERLEAALPDRKIRLFQREEDFLQAAQANPEHLLLVDFNYGGLRSGLTLIEEEELKERAVLLSGRISFDEQIQFQALSAGVRMCPKECIV